MLVLRSDTGQMVPVDPGVFGMPRPRHHAKSLNDRGSAAYRAVLLSGAVANGGGFSIQRGLGASGQSVAGQSLLASGQGFAAGGPIGAVVAGVASLIHSWISRVGPKQKVATTTVVNQAEILLKQNLAAWEASSKSCAEGLVCLNSFDQTWLAVVDACANPDLGDPGHSCIDDRLPPGVQFEYNTFSIVGNGMFPWFAWYRDPIAADLEAAGCCVNPPCYFPGCATASVCAPSGIVGGVESALGISPAASVGGVSLGVLLVPAALLLALWAVS